MPSPDVSSYLPKHTDNATFLLSRPSEMIRNGNPWRASLCLRAGASSPKLLPTILLWRVRDGALLRVHSLAGLIGTCISFHWVRLSPRHFAADNRFWKRLNGGCDRRGESGEGVDVLSGLVSRLPMSTYTCKCRYNMYYLARRRRQVKTSDWTRVISSSQFHKTKLPCIGHGHGSTQHREWIQPAWIEPYLCWTTAPGTHIFRPFWALNHASNPIKLLQGKGYMKQGPLMEMLCTGGSLKCDGQNSFVDLFDLNSKHRHLGSHT